METRNIYYAVAFLTECTLATVADLKMKKSASKQETSRQISIAQVGIDWCQNEEINLAALHANRAAEVIKKFNGRVKDWAEQYKP